ncbi:uncharacterized protein LOC129038343 [Pongo pygmaeus]|uniref:uncharacterized protein LOC129038343 n=1 Tax=Pongo pygmaeus TaxID=9600 RepID=UPI00300DA9F0
MIRSGCGAETRVPLPGAISAPAPVTPTHTHARRAHARPRLPAPSGSRRRRSELPASGPFRPRPLSHRGLAGRRATRARGGGAQDKRGGAPLPCGLARSLPGLPTSPSRPRRPLPAGRRFAGPAGAGFARRLNVHGAPRVPTRCPDRQPLRRGEAVSCRAGFQLGFGGFEAHVRGKWLCSCRFAESEFLRFSRWGGFLWGCGGKLISSDNGLEQGSLSPSRPDAGLPADTTDDFIGSESVSQRS